VARNSRRGVPVLVTERKRWAGLMVPEFVALDSTGSGSPGCQQVSAGFGGGHPRRSGQKDVRRLNFWLYMVIFVRIPLLAVLTALADT
jgi:hypothetical protein